MMQSERNPRQCFKTLSEDNHFSKGRNTGLTYRLDKHANPFQIRDFHAQKTQRKAYTHHVQAGHHMHCTLQVVNLINLVNLQLTPSSLDIISFYYHAKSCCSEVYLIIIVESTSPFGSGAGVP